MTIFFGMIAVTVVLAFRYNREGQKGSVFQKLAQQHLNNSDNLKLIELAEERIDSSPQDYMAYWYLGKAQFYRADFVKSKLNFEKVIELDPTMSYDADKWIEEIDTKLELGPQLVK